MEVSILGLTVSLFIFIAIMYSFSKNIILNYTRQSLGINYSNSAFLVKNILSEFLVLSSRISWYVQKRIILRFFFASFYAVTAYFLVLRAGGANDIDAILDVEFSARGLFPVTSLLFVVVCIALAVAFSPRKLRVAMGAAIGFLAASYAYDIWIFAKDSIEMFAEIGSPEEL